MKLPEVQIKSVESLGRNSLGAVGGVASATAGLANAQASVINSFAKVAGTMAETQDRIEYDQNTADYKSNLENWQMKYGAKKSFNGEEIAGMVGENVNLKENISDDSGGSKSVYRKNIPAYEVYGTMLSKKMEGLQKSYSGNIRNNTLKGEFVNSTTALRDQKMLKQTLRAAEEQHQQERTNAKVRIENYAKSGQLKEALFEAEKFNGTNEEREQLAGASFKKVEQYQYGEAVRTENMELMATSLATLQSEDYYTSGVLTEAENIAEQNQLKSAMARLASKNDTGEKVYKQGVIQQAETTVKAMKKGYIPKADEINGLMADVARLELGTQFENLKFAAKHAPGISQLRTIPRQQSNAFINEYVKQFKGAEAFEIRDYMNNAAKQMDREVEKDTVQYLLDNNMASVPAKDDPLFFRKMTDIFKTSKGKLGKSSGILSDAQADEYVEKFKDASSGDLYSFAQTVNKQLTPAEQEILYRQLNSRGVGDMVVMGDLAARNNLVGAQLLFKGKALRADPNRKIMPAVSKFKVSQKAIGALYEGQPKMQEYISKAVLDIYAGLTEGSPNTSSVDSGKLEEAMQLAIGATGEFNGQLLRMPSSDVTAEKFATDLRRTAPAWIDELGSVAGMPSDKVLSEINNGNFKLRNSPERGVYIVETLAGGQLALPDDGSGIPKPFYFRYDENMPVAEEARRTNVHTSRRVAARQNK